MLEALAYRKSVLDGLIRPGPQRVLGIFGHQARALGSLDELLDQRGAVTRNDLAHLSSQTRRRDRARVAAEVDARVAAVVLDEHGKTHRRRGALGVCDRAGDHVGRRGDPLEPAGRLHLDAGRLVVLGRGAGERYAVLLQGLDHFDAGDILIRRAVAQVEVQVEAAVDHARHVLDAGLFLQGRHVPLGLGHERPGVAGPIVRGEGVGVQVLGCEQADAHAGYLSLMSRP